MCELFAYCSRVPARVRFAFREFARHSGPHAANPDGWGAAYFEGVDAHVLREAQPALTSTFVPVLEKHDFHSPLVIAHIRRASRGPVALVNTQPFGRELFGRRQVFAHNGDLPDIERALPLPHAAHRPMGQTDSEHAFYVLMHDLMALDTAGGSDDLKRRIERVAGFASRLRTIGPANFLFTDGDLLFAHAHRRLSHPGNTWVAGLHMLTREAASEHQVRASGLHIQGRDDRPAPAVLLASVPLTPEVWEPLPENTLLVLQQGRLIARLTS
jgi:glutamine amidotransferase